MSLENASNKNKKAWNREACIALYCDLQFALFPLGFKAKDELNTEKIPFIKSWQRIKFNELLQRAGKGFHAGRSYSLGNAYGVVLPADIVILDTDPRNYPEGVSDQLERFLAYIGIEKLPPTFTVKTGGVKPGRHYYFRIPSGIVVKTKLQDFPGIDVKRIGGLVVGAGSKNTVTGNYYEVVDDSQIADIPEELLTELRTVDVTRHGNDVEYADEHTQKRFKNFLLNEAAPAISGAGGNATTLQVAFTGRDWGLPEQLTFDLMWEHYNQRCQPVWDQIDMRIIVQNAYKYARKAQGQDNPQTDFADIPAITPDPKEPPTVSPYPKMPPWDIEKKTRTKKPTINNAIKCLTSKFLDEQPNPLYSMFRFNLFSKQVEFVRPAPWHTNEDDKPKNLSDSDIIRLLGYLIRNQRVEFSKETLWIAAYDVARFMAYHPIRDELRALEWDGVARLDYLYSKYCGAEDSLYVRDVSRCTLLSAVKRIFEPGCQQDHVPILEGPQSLGKSSFVRILAGEWYCDFHIDPKNKDTVQLMMDSWIIEASEMAMLTGQRGGDMQSLKAFITRPVDKVRLPYERAVVTLPRQCIFIGTYNVNPDEEGGYFQDATGNRRYWPVVCTKIDTKLLAQDRNQLLAEAYARYMLGEEIYMTDPEVLELARQEQTKRQVTDVWDDAVATWLQERTINDLLPADLTTTIIAEEAIGITVSQMKKQEQMRIAGAMRKAGYISVQRRENGRRKRVWVRKDDPLLDYSEEMFEELGI